MKHAYLIIAHNNFYILERLIKLLDDKNNDIYVHIDKKVKENKIYSLNDLCKESNIFIIENRLRINWGGYTQIKCELLLLEKSVINNYDYYHLLSGVDLPIKSKKYIYNFFKENKGKEFLDFCSNEYIFKNNIIDRVDKYYFFNEFISRDKNNIINRFLTIINSISLRLQKEFNIHRVKDNGEKISYGANWFSITNDLANYVIENKKNIIKKFRFTRCADEIFLQTLVYNSRFINNIYNYDRKKDIRLHLREIDWKRGGPYTFRSEDFEYLMDSNNLFARKFDYATDKNIIDKIYRELNINQ